MMKRKIEEEFELNDEYNIIINKIDENSSYLLKLTNNLEMNYIEIYKIIYNIKEIYEECLNKLDYNIIFKIKKEMDLFFYLLSIGNKNTDIFIKLINKINHKLYKNDKK